MLTPIERHEIKIALAWLTLPEIEREREKMRNAEIAGRKYTGGSEKRTAAMLARREKVKELWEQGLCAAHIAREIGHHRSIVTNDLSKMGLRKVIKVGSRRA